MQGSDETDPLRFGTRDLPHHWLAPRGSRIPALQSGIHATFVKIDEVLGLQVSQLILELCASVLVSFGVAERFFFE